MSLFEMFDADCDGDDDAVFAPSTSDYPIGCSVKIAADRLRSASLVPQWLRDHFALMPAVAKGVVLRHDGDYSFVSWMFGVDSPVEIAATVHRGYLSSPQAKERPDVIASCSNGGCVGGAQSSSSSPRSQSSSAAQASAKMGVSVVEADGADAALSDIISQGRGHIEGDDDDDGIGCRTIGGGNVGMSTPPASSSSSNSRTVSNASAAAVIISIRSLREAGNAALAASSIDDALVMFTDALRLVPCQVFACSLNGTAAHRAAHARTCRRMSTSSSSAVSTPPLSSSNSVVGGAAAAAAAAVGGGAENSSTTMTTHNSNNVSNNTVASSAATSGRTTPQLNLAQLEEFKQECCSLLVNRSALYLSQKNPKAAARDAVAAVQLHPQSRRALIAQVNSTSAMNLHQYAISALHELNTLEPSPETRLALGRSMLSAFFQERGARVCCTVDSPQHRLRLYARANCAPMETLFSEKPFLIGVPTSFLGSSKRSSSGSGGGSSSGGTGGGVESAAPSSHPSSSSWAQSSLSFLTCANCCAFCCYVNARGDAAGDRPLLANKCCATVYCSTECKVMHAAVHTLMCPRNGSWSDAVSAVETVFVSNNSNDNRNSGDVDGAAVVGGIEAEKMRFATSLALNAAAIRATATTTTTTAAATTTTTTTTHSSSSSSCVVVPLVSSFSSAVSCTAQHLQQIVSASSSSSSSSSGAAMAMSLSGSGSEEHQQHHPHDDAGTNNNNNTSSAFLQEALRGTVSEQNSVCYKPLRQWLRQLKAIHESLPRGTMSFETLLRFVAFVLGCAVELPYHCDPPSSSRRQSGSLNSAGGGAMTTPTSTEGGSAGSPATSSTAADQQSNNERGGTTTTTATTCIACFTLAGNLSRHVKRTWWWSNNKSSSSSSSEVNNNIITTTRNEEVDSSSAASAASTAGRGGGVASRLVYLSPVGNEIESTATDVQIICKERVAPGVWLAL